MLKRYLLSFSILCLANSFAQTITPTQTYTVCDPDGDGFVSVPFSELQNYALDFLNEFNESPEIYVTKAYNGIAKITNLYNNPQVVNVCESDGNGGYYDIAINNQQEIFIVRNNGILQKIDPQSCAITNITQIHSSGQSVLALSFDKLNHLYEGGWSSQVYRADAQDLTQFYLWHDFGNGRAAGDFVQIGDFLYVAWTVNGHDYLYKVTLGPNNSYVSHQNLGQIDSGTYGLAAEYGKLYGNTPDYLYEIDLNTMQTHIISYRPNMSNTSSEWWGAAGLHEALEIEISYHGNLTDAINGNNEISDPYVNPTPFTGQVFIRVHEETNQTTYIIPVQIIVQVSPMANDTTLRECLDENAGVATFDLSQASNQINGNAGVQYSYFATLNDLNNNQNTLPTLLSITQSQTVFVKVEEANNNCFGIAELELIVPTADQVEYDNRVAFCLGTEAVLSIPDEFVYYHWNGVQTQDSNQNLNSNEIIVTQPGNYSVTVTNAEGCQFTLPIEVVLGSAPVITNIERQGNAFTVKVSPSGNYEYSLNGIIWQNSPTFYNLEPNDYTFFVRDFAGCRSDKFDYTYFQIPNFISPNGDGFNDVWRIRGMADYPNAHIKIFDRYGKIFVDRKIYGNEIIWDGKYLGRPLPSGSYWYILQLDENQKPISGSISIKN